MSKVLMLSLPLPSITSPREWSSGNTSSHKPSLARRRRPSHLVFAMKRDADYDHRGRSGKLVDENMIVLRMRISEMEAAEARHLPESWMEWEKRYYASYDYGWDICQGVGVLQRWLMKTRPSLALAIVTLVAISIPMSSAVIVWQMMHIFRGLLPN